MLTRVRQSVATLEIASAERDDTTATVRKESPHH